MTTGGNVNRGHREGQEKQVASSILQGYFYSWTRRPNGRLPAVSSARQAREERSVTKSSTLTRLLLWPRVWQELPVWHIPKRPTFAFRAPHKCLCCCFTIRPILDHYIDSPKMNTCDGANREVRRGFAKRSKIFQVHFCDFHFKTIYLKTTTT